MKNFKTWDKRTVFYLKAIICTENDMKTALILFLDWGLFEATKYLKSTQEENLIGLT